MELAAITTRAPPDTRRTSLSLSMYARKANFDDVYNRQDPRAYFAALHPLDYAVPHYAQPVIRNCVGRIAHLRGIARPVVLDLCAGYGINGALLNHVLTLEKLYAHYVGSSTRDLSAEELLAYDQFFYRCFRRRDSCAAVIGLDIAAEAIAYAQGAGLVDHGVVCDLERTDPDVKTRQLLGAADLITVTGGISYIGDHSLRRLLSY
ncbi:MAG: hypothetical protein ACR2RB_20500, partial [Gammaproteobacteria bacterium]